MKFGEALTALKCGSKVTRNGWNGKNMYLWLKPGTLIIEDMCHDPVLKKIVHENGGTMEALPTICMKTADNKILTGWLASQTDMLSNDWEIYLGEKSDDWYIPEDELPTLEEMEKIFNDTRFEKEVDDATTKLIALNKNPEHSIEVFDDLKAKYKIEEGEYNPQERTDIQLFTAEVQNVGTQILRMHGDKESQTKYLNEAKDELLEKADTDEKKSVLEENFTIFEEYINNK